MPAPATVQPHQRAANGGNESGNSQALATLPPLEEEESDPVPFSAPVARLPVVREFRVRNLLALQPGQLIESQWGNGEDVPLASGEVQLAWSEFEVIDSQLAVRITRLA
jgi:flagellar motor switch protein FliN/FliY